MTINKRTIYGALLALVLSMTLLPLLALAQPVAAASAASAASAPAVLTAADITFDTACGAGGIGRIWAGERREQIEPRPPTPGERVNVDGYWSAGCRPPAPPPPPKACPGSGAAVTWDFGDHTCTTARPRNSEPASARQQGLQHGQSQVLRQWIGTHRGTLIERCSDGVRTVVSATCKPATECDTAWSRTEVGGTTYTVNARPAASRIPLGGYALANGADGSTLRVQCVAGEIVAAPQCVGPQRVSRLYTTETRIYEYAGSPVEVGKLVRAEQLHVVRDGIESPGNNKIRWTLARCSATGKLQ